MRARPMRGRGSAPGSGLSFDVERVLQSAGRRRSRGRRTSLRRRPRGPRGLSVTALGYLLWCARGHRLLSRDEEVACGEAVRRARLAGGKPASERSDSESRLLEAGARARARLVLSSIRLVAKLAGDPSVRGRLDMDDLVQAGLLGLVRAVDRYDPAFETRFSTYAVWWIRRSILQSIRRRRLHDSVARPCPQACSEAPPSPPRARVRRSVLPARHLARVGGARLDRDRDGPAVASLAGMRVVSLDDRVDPWGEATYAERVEADSPSPRASTRSASATSACTVSSRGSATGGSRTSWWDASVSTGTTR